MYACVQRNRKWLSECDKSDEALFLRDTYITSDTRMYLLWKMGELKVIDWNSFCKIRSPDFETGNIGAKTFQFLPTSSREEKSFFLSIKWRATWAVKFLIRNGNWTNAD